MICSIALQTGARLIILCTGWEMAMSTTYLNHSETLCAKQAMSFAHQSIALEYSKFDVNLGVAKVTLINSGMT